MKYILFCLLFVSVAMVAQPVVITIEKITAADSLRERSFKVDFTLENVSEKTVAFFLDPKNFIPAQGGPLANAVFYKIYQEKELLEASGILGTRIELNAGHKLAKYSKLSMAEINTMRIQKTQGFFETMITLVPNEKRSYSRELLWHYDRYQKHGDNEFYIDPDKSHYLQLMLIFWREEYETKLTEEQFDAVMANESIIKGWFVSNKVEIDFSN